MMNLPEEVMEKLKGVESEEDAVKILSAHGIDVEKVRKSLSEDELNEVSGGGQAYLGECPFCGETDPSKLVKDDLASIFSGGYMAYGCTRCHKKFFMHDNGYFYKEKK